MSPLSCSFLFFLARLIAFASNSPPVFFIAGRPKAALLLWFFGDFRCGALLFVVIHVIYKYKKKVKIVVKC